jgi:hypothetical protein
MDHGVGTGPARVLKRSSAMEALSIIYPAVPSFVVEPSGDALRGTPI